MRNKIKHLFNNNLFSSLCGYLIYLIPFNVKDFENIYLVTVIYYNPVF